MEKRAEMEGTAWRTPTHDVRKAVMNGTPGGQCQVGNAWLFQSYFPFFQSPPANIKRRYEAYRFGVMCGRWWPGVGV